MKNNETFKNLSENFQMKIIGNLFLKHFKNENNSITEYPFSEIVLNNLDIYVFQNEGERLIYKIIKDYFEKYNSMISLDILREEINSKCEKIQMEYLNEKINQIEKYVLIINKQNNIAEIKYVEDNLIPYIYQNKVREYLKFMQISVEKNNFDEFNVYLQKMNKIEKIDKAKSRVVDISNVGKELVSNHRLLYIPKLDKIFRNNTGFTKNDTMMVCAGGSMGKTSFLRQIANLSYQNNMNVAHIFYENEISIFDMQNYHFQMLFNMSFDKINLLEQKEKDKMLFEYQKNKNSNLFLLPFNDSMSVNDIIFEVGEYASSKGIKIDRIVVDYIDRIKYSTKNTNVKTWENEEMVMPILSTFALNMDAHLIFGTQATFQKSNDFMNTTKAEFVYENNIGGHSIKKQLSKFILGIHATPEMQSKNLRNINIIKNNFGITEQFKNEKLSKNFTLLI